MENYVRLVTRSLYISCFQLISIGYTWIQGVCKSIVPWYFQNWLLYSVSKHNRVFYNCDFTIGVSMTVSSSSVWFVNWQRKQTVSYPCLYLSLRRSKWQGISKQLLEPGICRDFQVAFFFSCSWYCCPLVWCLNSIVAHLILQEGGY